MGIATNYFVHSLLRARGWQHRPQLDQVFDWWADRSSGVCALVGMGGAGKTAIADRFLDDLLNDTNASRQRKSPESVFVYSFYDDDIPENFFRHLQFWLDGTSAPEKQKSPTQLMFDIQQHQGLIILDGLEKVQESGARGGFGRLTSPSLRDLLNHIACGSARKLSMLVTSRFPLSDLRDSQCRYFQTIPVDQIDVVAGVALLRERGVRGTDMHLVPIVEQCGRHALTVDFAAGYIKEYGQGDPATPLNLGTTEELQAEAEQEPNDDKRDVLKQGIRFARIAQRYREAMLNTDEAAIALLERICLFRLGVDCDTLTAIFTGPPAERVSGSALAKLDACQLQKKLDWLSKLGIVEPIEYRHSAEKVQMRYTIHPAVRDGFLSGINRDIARSSHEAIQQGLELSLGDAPGKYPFDQETLDLIEEIIHHALETGNTRVAWSLYQNRLGGCQNLLAKLNDFVRVSRVTNAILRSQETGDILSAEITTILRSDYGYSCVELGQLASAAQTLSIGVDQCYKTRNSNLKTLLTNLACALSASGRLKRACETLGSSLRELRSPDAIQQVLLHMADINTLRGTVRETISAEVVRLHTKGAFSSNAIGFSPKTVCHSSLDVHRPLIEFQTQVEELCRQGEQAELADARLDLSARLLWQGDVDTALDNVAAAQVWAVDRNSRRTLCRCSLMRARILLSTFSSEFAGDSKADASKVEASLVQGLTIARDCGYGLYHIDLLLERARMHLLQGSADAALDDIEVALDTGIAADDETGQVDLLAANHEECGYAWAIPYGLQLRAEALLLQAAQKLDSSTFIPAHRSALPPAVEDLLINAESCLTQALSRWHGLRDPEPERPDQNFQLGGKEYNHLSAATHRVVTDLACGLLTRYQLVRTNVTQIERKNVETVDDPKLRDDTLWLALEHAIRNVREEKQILWERKPEWEKGLNSEKINQLAQKARISERPVFEILTPIVQGGIETDRFLRVHHPDYVDPLDLCVWMKFGSPNIADKKIERLIAYLQSWQSKRSQQLRAAEAVSGPSIDPTSVSIGILTALPKEYAAVKVLLTNSQLFHQPGQGAGRTYVIGTIASDFGGLHRVALAMADMGNNIAAARATLLLEHFPSLESILMVGIAGGVPSPTKLDDHVRLGDIVVSCKKGVVQYDMVKLEEIRCCPIAPSARLVEGVRHLEAGELESKRPWDALIEFVLKQLKNERPEPATDQLFDSHDPQKSVTHPIDRKRYPDRPRVFLGPIASANELLKDPIKRDSLRDVFGVKAVEMEGSGIADASWMFEKGYLVVRGICDYCDTHKNNIWQEYAAASAGAYAAALVASLPVQNPRKHP